MNKVYLCSAIATPLRDDESLCSEGLLAHLNDQASVGIDGVLVAGTMGAMPLLTADTYAALIDSSVAAWRKRGELLIGVGDLSYARTRERIQLANAFTIDGVVVLTPFFLKFSQAELIEYFEALAAESRSPLFLYDLPQRTGVPLELETVLRLSKHPNIRGIKCSGDIAQTRRLIAELEGSDFRVIVAQAPSLHLLLRDGVNEHVDGIYSLVPQIVNGIAVATAKKDFDRADELARRMQGLLDMLVKYGVFAATTAFLNHRGIRGNFAPRPHATLPPEVREQFLAEPAIQAAITIG